MKRFLVFLVSIMVSAGLSAQVTATQSAAGNNQAMYAPLSLLINGEGTVRPYSDGQMLQVGRRFSLMPVPAPGYRFESWQPVNVFTLQTTIVLSGSFGEPPTVMTTTSKNFSLIPAYRQERLLRFVMQPEAILFEDVTTNLDGTMITNTSLSQGTGWQVNLVPLRRGFR